MIGCIDPGVATDLSLHTRHIHPLLPKEFFGRGLLAVRLVEVTGDKGSVKVKIFPRKRH